MFVCLFKFYVYLFCFYCLIICSRLWYSSLLAIFILTNFCKIFFLGGFDLSVLFKICFTDFFFFFLNAGKKTSTTVEYYMKTDLAQNKMAMAYLRKHLSREAEWNTFFIKCHFAHTRANLLHLLMFTLGSIWFNHIFTS